MEKWTKIRRDILVEEMSRREACRKYNLNFRTIQKILKHSEPPEKPKEYARPKPKIGPFIDRLWSTRRSKHRVSRSQ